MTRPLFLGSLQGSEAPADKRQRLFLTDEDRKTGLHVIGAPKTGKSKFLEHLIRQDIDNGHGLCLIDPHGALYEDVLEWCAYARPNRHIIPLNLSRGEHVIGFNPFLRAPGDVAAQVERCLDATIKAWGRSNTDESPRLDRVLGALFHTLIEADDLTLCEAHYFLTYKLAEVRDYLASRIGDGDVRGMWLDLAAVRTFEQFNTQVESSRNRLTRFLRAEVTRRYLALTDPSANLDLRAIMDRGAVLLVNLKRSDQLSKANQRLIGTLLVNALVDAALRRDVGAGREPRPFHLYLDEFHNFVTVDIGEAVTQVRKFGLTFILAHQTLNQVRREEADILSELMGAVKARAVFGGCSATDAAELVPELFPGQIDYTEVKFMRETVKFWPVYDRDQVITRGTAHTDTHTTSRSAAHTEGEGSIDGWAEGESSLEALGHSVPYHPGFPVSGGGMSFDSTGWGHISSTSGAVSSMSSDTVGTGESDGTADTTSEAVADVPIYHQVPYIEKQPEHFTLEDQRQRLADTLILQYQRHCFIRPPNDRAQPLLIPLVERYPLPEARVRAYEAQMAKLAGAMTPAQVDELMAARTRQIEHRAREFAAQKEVTDFDVAGGEPVHSKDDESQPSTTRTRSLKPTPHLRPAADKKKPAEGSSGAEG